MDGGGHLTLEGLHPWSTIQRDLGTRGIPYGIQIYPTLKVSHQGYIQDGK